MKNELVNFVNNMGSYWICFVTKIKNRFQNEMNFNLQNKTSHHPSYVVHQVHQFTAPKTQKIAEFAADFLKKHVFSLISCELNELLLTTLMARRIFAHPATDSILACVNFCEYSIFEVHSLGNISQGGNNMKNWCYVKTADGHEGFVQVDPTRPLHGQVSDRAVVIGYDPNQQNCRFSNTIRPNGIMPEMIGYGTLALMVVLLVAIFA